MTSIKKKNNLIGDNNDKPISKSSSHYVSNPALLNEFVMWNDAKKIAKEKDLPEPKIPENIGRGIMQIADNFSKKYNWISNSRYREELVGDAIINCLTYIDRFNPEKFKNPFSYFTQISYFSFLRTIEREKKSDYIRHKSMMNSVLFQELQIAGVDEEDISLLEDFSYDTTGVDEFIEAFELKMFNKKLASNEIAGNGGKTKILATDEVGFL